MRYSKGEGPRAHGGDASWGSNATGDSAQGVLTRVLQRLFALTAAIWHSYHCGFPRGNDAPNWLRRDGLNRPAGHAK